MICAISCACVVIAPRTACGAWPWSGDPAKEAVGTAQWWKKQQEERRVRAGQGLQGRRRRRLLRRRRPADSGPGRAGSESSKPAKTTDEVGLMPGPRSARAVRQNESGRRAGAERTVRAAVPMSKAIACSAKRNTTRRPRSFKAAVDARAAFADRAGCDVHARRELLLRRPLHQGPRRLRRAGERASQHALSGYGDRPRVEDRPLLGGVRRKTTPTGR